MAGCYSEVTWNGLGILFEKHSVWRNGDPKGTDKQMCSFEAILCQVKKCNYNWSPSKENEYLTPCLLFPLAILSTVNPLFLASRMALYSIKSVPQRSFPKEKTFRKE